MVAVLAGEVSPVSSGIVYCGVILACEEAHDLRRAREWTTALTDWAKGQPDLVAFTGRCLVHRAQIMRLDGSWQAAMDEAHRAAERCLEERTRPQPARPTTSARSTGFAENTRRPRRRTATRAARAGSRNRDSPC